MINQNIKISEGIVENYITGEAIINLLKENSSFLELMKDIMQIGKEISDKIGHKDYPSIEDFFKDIVNGSSPIVQLDDSWKVIGRIENVMWLGITNCPVKRVMIDLLENPQDDDVSIYLEDVHLLEREKFNSITIGSYALLQIRQMVAASLSIKGDYRINMMNLLTQRPEISKDGVVIEFLFAENIIDKIASNSNLTVENIKNRINELLVEHQHDLCLYAVIVNEASHTETENVLFHYYVITEAGIPFFQYPKTKSPGMINIDDLLFSGLITALNIFSFRATGNPIHDLNFGSLHATFSRDLANNIHVLLTEQNIHPSISKQIHIELTSLFSVAAARFGISESDKKGRSSIIRNKFPDNEVRAIFEPFYKTWANRIKKTKKNKKYS